MNQGVIDFILGFLKGTPFEQLAEAIEADIKAGSANFENIDQIVEYLLQIGEHYWVKGSRLLKALEATVATLPELYAAFAELNANTSSQPAQP